MSFVIIQYMIDVHMLQVFTDARGDFGDVASVVVDEGRGISNVKRKALARQLRTGETAFINNISSADISIVHPHGEIDFAGVAALGTAWLLAKLSPKPVPFMNGRSGRIVISQDEGLVWVRASLASMPPWNHLQLENAVAVEHINLDDTKDWKHTMVWAWANEAKGLIRARTFANDWEIPEAEGNGSGAMILAGMVQRPIEIRHGSGSVIFAKLAPGDCADLGGRVRELKGKHINPEG